MSLGPFLRRELITSVRRGGAFNDRFIAVVLVTAAIAGCVGFWDWWGWDRASVAGAARFAEVTSRLIVVALTLIAIGESLRVARSIASERDRKSLDALLATRLSGAEIVLGTIVAGLIG